MAERSLSGCHVLVVEDEYMLADELATELQDAGATVLGPAGTLEEAIELIALGEHVDGVILDVNLRGEMVFSVADLLLERGLPFLFTTGYDASTIPARFNHVVRCDKPVSIKQVVQAIGDMIQR